jgi:hypothetical protein
MTTTCLLAWAAALLLLPVLVVLNLTESKPFKARRLRRQGLTWKACAARMGCSATTARRWALG